MSKIEIVARDLYLHEQFGRGFLDNSHGQVPGRLRHWNALPEEDFDIEQHPTVKKFVVNFFERDGIVFARGKQSYRHIAQFAIDAYERD